MIQHRWLAALPLIAITACGGSGSIQSSSPNAVVPLASPSHGTGTVTVTISIPKRIASASRTPRYVSPSAQSIRVDVYPVSAGIIAGSPSNTSLQDLSASSPGCSGGSPNVCTITLGAPAGVTAFGIKLYAGLGQSGAILSQLDPTAATERTIVAGANNVTLPLVLAGVPASLTASAPPSSFSGGISASLPYTIVAKDAAGNIIIGAEPYEIPITPTTSDSSAISFTPATVLSPNTTVTLNYSGTATTSTVTTGASSGAVTSANIPFSFTPAPPSVACFIGCSGLANGSTPYTLAISEPGYTGSFTLGHSGAGCNIDPSGVANLSNGTGSINVYPNPQGGTCTINITDRYSQNASGTPNFIAANPPANGGNCGESIYPSDPFGGALSFRFGCAGSVISWGSYTIVALDSITNLGGFVIAIYANPTQAPVRSITDTAIRYITASSVNIGTSTVTYTGQSGTSPYSFSSFVP